MEAPSLEQIANTYQKIIKPEWKFEISDVVFWTSQVSNLIVAKLSFNGRDEIVNAEGNPVSGSALHMTLVNLDTSVASEKDKIEQIVSKLKEKLIGKMIKIGERNGQADLEFGVSGSANRIRPCQSAQEIFSKSYAKEINEGFVSVKDGKLFYRVVGKGLPLIVLHGGPGGLSQDYLLPQLYKLAENNLVVFYDQRGSGRSLETKLDEKHINRPLA